MAKYSQSIYTPINEEKYVGKGKIHMRSSWETVFARMCDNNPAITQWASEPFMIPYVNPFTKKKTIYVPDFLIVYTDKHDKQHAELIEVKPLKETALEHARSKRDKAAVILNLAKWQMARAWAKNQGMRFRIITERDLFSGGKPGK